MNCAQTMRPLSTANFKTFACPLSSTNFKSFASFTTHFFHLSSFIDTSLTPALLTDWPEPGDGSGKDLVAYWQEDWDNGEPLQARARLLLLHKNVTIRTEDVDADFAQQLRIELQKSAAASK
jgi:hypothetical protein